MLYCVDNAGRFPKGYKGYGDGPKMGEVLVPSGMKVFFSHHEANKLRLSLANPDAFEVYGVIVGGGNWPYEERPDGWFLTKPRPIYVTAVMYAITCIRVVPDGQQFEKWLFTPEDREKITRLLAAEGSKANYEELVRLLGRKREVFDEDYKERARLSCCAEGWTVALKDAQWLVEHNSGDMSDQGWCQYAVIEELPEGMWPESMHGDRRWFYRWVRNESERDRGHYEKMDKVPTDWDDETISCYYLQG